MALKRIFAELNYLQECERKGLMIVPCKIFTSESNVFQWTVEFYIGADGIVLDTVRVLIQFPANYPFCAPRIIMLDSQYKLIDFCLNEKTWSPAAQMISVLPHIYLSIVDPDYSQNTKIYTSSHSQELSSPSLIDRSEEK